MNRLFMFAALIPAMIAGKGEDLRTADLLFVVSGASEFSEAISQSTANLNDLSFSHVAIAFVSPTGNVSVIEASPERGVSVTDLTSFLDESPKIGDKPAVTVKRLIADFTPVNVIENAMGYINEPYDWWYMPDNGRMYCSELVYESFLTDTGEHLFQCEPMNFRSKDGSLPDFWVNLFKELDCDVPEGMPGTNPNSMYRDERLIEIKRYF